MIMGLRPLVFLLCVDAASAAAAAAAAASADVTVTVAASTSVVTAAVVDVHVTVVCNYLIRATKCTRSKFRLTISQLKPNFKSHFQLRRKHTNTHAYVYKHTHTHTQTQTHKHTHTHRLSFNSSVIELLNFIAGANVKVCRLRVYVCVCVF